MTNTLHIRDKSTGLFYVKQEFHGHDARKPCTLAYSAKGFGKVFKDLGKLKVHLLHLIGNMDPPKMIDDLRTQMYARMSVLGRTDWDADPEYRRLRDEIDCWHELHPGYSNVPEWMTNPYPVDEIPEDWEVVEVTDKKQRKWTVVDFNPAGYAEEAKRLRRLTDNYGSAIRDVYKKLEKSGKMQELPWVAAVMLDISTLQQKNPNWWEGATVDAAPVDEVIKQMNVKRNNMVRTTKKESIAIAFRTQEEAFWFKMCYTGLDRVNILDMVHLTEVVEEPNTP